MMLHGWNWRQWPWTSPVAKQPVMSAIPLIAKSEVNAQLVQVEAQIANINRQINALREEMIVTKKDIMVLHQTTVRR